MWNDDSVWLLLRWEGEKPGQIKPPLGPSSSPLRRGSMSGEEVDPRLRGEDDVECGELFATIKKRGRKGPAG